MPEGQKAGPKGRQLEVGAQRAPWLLVFNILFLTNIFNIGNTGTELREQGRGSPGELGQSFVSFLGKLPYIKCE